MCKSNYSCWGNGECNTFLNSSKHCYDGGDCTSKYRKISKCNDEKCCTQRLEDCKEFCDCKEDDFSSSCILECWSKPGVKENMCPSSYLPVTSNEVLLAISPPLCVVEKITAYTKTTPVPGSDTTTSETTVSVSRSNTIIPCSSTTYAFLFIICINVLIALNIV